MRELEDWPRVMSDAVAIDSTYSTPLTGKVGQVGTARLKSTPYSRGVYRMESVGGLEYWYADQRVPVTSLQRRHDGKWRTWMVDDPLHWYGMRERVDAMPGGDVLCAGLGLGLMLWHLYERSDVSSITVVEVDEDVVALMRPLIPDDDRITVVNDDYYWYIERTPVSPDAILWDLAVGDQDDTRVDMMRGFYLTKARFPRTPLFRFGVKTVGGE